MGSAARRRSRSARRRAAALLLAALACTTSGGPPGPGASNRSAVPIPEILQHAPLDPALVRVEPEGLTVEQSLLLDVYTLFHAKDYRAFRVRAPDGEDDEITAHLMIPPGPGPHPAVVVFPILAGNHVVSEALAKALVDRRLAILRIERRPLLIDQADSPEYVSERMSSAVRAARRLLDWLVTHPEIDRARIGTAGVSFGSLLACLLQAADARVQAGFFALTGGGMAEIIHASREKPVRVFRERMAARHGLETRQEFVAWLQPQLDAVDPLTYAGGIDPASVLMVSSRFDRIMPPERARALWEALGRPSWLKIPTGHYQALPLLWYVAARGVDHFDRRFARNGSAPDKHAPGEDP